MHCVLSQAGHVPLWAKLSYLSNGLLEHVAVIGVLIKVKEALDMRTGGGRRLQLMQRLRTQLGGYSCRLPH